MKPFQFLKFCAFIFLILALVNVPLNLLFEKLKREQYITELSVDGFKTWSLHLDRQDVKKTTAPDERFNAEFKPLAEIAKYPNSILILGSSVVSGDGIEPGQRFSDRLNDISSRRENTYFVNAGRSGSELYTYIQNIPALIDELKQVRCVIWLPNRNDLLSQRELKQVLAEKQTAAALSSVDKMPWFDYLFFGFYKRLGQRFTFEGNMLKERSLESPHQLYYTNGLLLPLGDETVRDLTLAIHDFDQALKARSVHFSAVFLPPRHFNHHYAWPEARSLGQVAAILNNEKILSQQFFDPLRGTDDYVDYIHFNPKGHENVAKLLENNLDTLCPK